MAALDGTEPPPTPNQGDALQSASTSMILDFSSRAGSPVLCLIAMLAVAPAFGAGSPAPAPARASDATEETRGAPGDAEAIVSTTPMTLEVEGAAAHGHLMGAEEILTPGARAELVYSITGEPLHGRVRLAGGDDDSDLFATKRSRVGYFVYQAQDDFVGEDSFSYTVRNETNGLVFKNTVVITVKPPPAVELPEFEITADRTRAMNVREVALTIRPNTPVTATVPSHQDFMSPEDRDSIKDPKVANSSTRGISTTASRC
ncbi:MAG: hypothetical protein ACREIA_11870 [Opitutaceae bacterium]